MKFMPSIWIFFYRGMGFFYLFMYFNILNFTINKNPLSLRQREWVFDCK